LNSVVNKTKQNKILVHLKKRFNNEFNSLINELKAQKLHKFSLKTSAFIYSQIHLTCYSCELWTKTKLNVRLVLKSSSPAVLKKQPLTQCRPTFKAKVVSLVFQFKAKANQSKCGNELNILNANYYYLE
jgi:hypothetical protein